MTRYIGHVINRCMTTIRVKANLLGKNLNYRSQTNFETANNSFESESAPRIVASDSVTNQGGLKSLFSMLSQFVAIGGDFV